MKTLMFYTQLAENYGSVEDPYWKMKGGWEYRVRNVPSMLSRESIMTMLETFIAEANSDMMFEHLMSYEFVEDDFMTDFERSQLEFEGEVLYPAQEVDYSDLVNILAKNSVQKLENVI